VLARRGAAVHAAGTLCIDRWQGTERVQLRICDLAPAEVPGAP
jgi:single-stranded-DNA-specific exonuclease